MQSIEREKTMSEGYYEYKELFERAIAPEATEADINKLGEWYERWGSRYWNGEFYDLDGRLRLYPIYKEVAEDEFEVTRYEIR